MLVLAVDTQANRDNQTTSIIGSTVTLAATPEEAQRLSLAAAMGELRLTLRTPDDTQIVRLPASKWDDLKRPTRDASGAKEEEEVAPPPATPPVPALPALPAPPKEVTPPPTVVVDKTPVKPPEPPPAKTHTLVIQNGEYRESGTFTFDPIGKVWIGGGLGQRADDAPRRRPTPPPAPPAQTSDSPDPAAPAFGPGSVH
jgi:hypothetical protein